MNMTEEGTVGKNEKEEEEEEVDNDKLYFKLYEYITKIDSFPGDDTIFEKEKNNIMLFRRKKKLLKCKNRRDNISLQRGDGHIHNNKGEILKEKKKKKKKKKIGVLYANNENLSNQLDGSKRDQVFFNTCSNEIGGDVKNVQRIDGVTFLQSNKLDGKREMEDASYDYLHNYSPRESPQEGNNVEKSSLHKGEFAKENKNMHDVRGEENMSSDRKGELFAEVENYYLMYKLNRKMEEYKCRNEINMINNERTMNISDICQKVEKILSSYEDIINELNMLVKNKRCIYKTFHSIFLNYYDKYEEIKKMKFHKRIIERYIRFYTNVAQFEAILDNMERNEYKYFVDIYSSTLRGVECSAASVEEDDIDSGDEVAEDEDDNDEDDNDEDDNEEDDNEEGDNEEGESDDKAVSARTDECMPRRGRRRACKDGEWDGKSAKRRSKKERRDNEIYYMLQYSEKAIHFFRKNNSFFDAKAKVTKYQSIIKRILKYVTNLFRDVLNNTDLNIPHSNRMYESSIFYNNAFCETEEKGNRHAEDTYKIIGDNVQGEKDSLIAKRYDACNNGSAETVSGKGRNMQADESNMQKRYLASDIPVDPLWLINDETEIDKMYNNVNIIYFSKYVDVVEYYEKYKIKCSCMKEIISFIYRKTLNDEKELYIDDYNSLESFYVSTRLKILNHNILKAFDNLSNKDICKYIKNVCLLAVYISKLEVNLFFYIFNSNIDASINIILNNIGMSVHDNINDNIYELNNIQIIRKVINIIYVDIVETYTDRIYTIVRDYFKKIGNTLKERLLYIIEMYISYYTKNTYSTIPYICFKPIRKKFIYIINDFLYHEYQSTPIDEKLAHHIENGNDEMYIGVSNKTEEFVIPTNSILNDNVNDGRNKQKRDNFDECKNTDDAGNLLGDCSSESVDSERNYKEHEYSINVLNESNVYKPFLFSKNIYNKDTTFCLTGVDINIIGTILILKTINFVIEENAIIDVFKECLVNTFNSVTFVYKQHLKNYDNDLFNGSLFLIKNLSFLLFLFFKVTKDEGFLNLYLDKELTEHLLFGVPSAEGGNRIDNTKMSSENKNAIFYLIRKVYNTSSNDDVQNKILASFNESIYNFTITTVARVCSPLIKILSVEYKDGASEKEVEIKKALHTFMSTRKEKDDCTKVTFSYLSQVDFDLLQRYALDGGVRNDISDSKGIGDERATNLQKNLQSFQQLLHHLFPKIYFYVKLFIMSNADQSRENIFFRCLFNYVMGVIKYRIIYLLSEVYMLLRYKYGSYIGTVFKENYINDIFLFLNCPETYVCDFAEIHKYYDAKENYNFWAECDI
ncbi:conserved Plasmodium protein, unknown function [Plasmodium ovale]|uniref:Uncharacterized protein n=1 Tax=Plasmodium ovale TaxID=36330 RepID=A0A1D3TKB3_PLAOA|nr:conserved Plasmodium protein, unknown function [Plasmodium ovale]